MKNTKYLATIVEDRFNTESDCHELIVMVPSNLSFNSALKSADKIVYKYENKIGNNHFEIIGFSEYVSDYDGVSPSDNDPIVERLSKINIDFNETITAEDSRDGKASCSEVGTTATYDDRASWRSVYEAALADSIRNGSNNKKARMDMHPIVLDEEHVEYIEPKNKTNEGSIVMRVSFCYKAEDGSFSVKEKRININDKRPVAEMLWLLRKEARVGRPDAGLDFILLD